mmetsp:Transcript_25981/g.46873  ORF Transcript_25981/g.46873 Transcript_25981/m.46873 type:complete len:90 (+) Transcript_25981:255-524(+)
MRPNNCTPATANMNTTTSINARMLTSQGRAKKSVTAQTLMPSNRLMRRSNLSVRSMLAPGPLKGSATIDAITRRKSNLLHTSDKYPRTP